MEDEPWMRMGVAANIAREYAKDQLAMFAMLAGLFERLLPGETEIKRRGIFGNGAIESFRITLAGNRYELTERKQRLEATCTHIVRGIALKTEPMTLEDWLAEVEAGLHDLAAKDQNAQSALKVMMGLDADG